MLPVHIPNRDSSEFSRWSNVNVELEVWNLMWNFSQRIEIGDKNHRNILEEEWLFLDR